MKKTQNVLRFIPYECNNKDKQTGINRDVLFVLKGKVKKFYTHLKILAWNYGQKNSHDVSYDVLNIALKQSVIDILYMQHTRLDDQEGHSSHVYCMMGNDALQTCHIYCPR